VGDAAGVPVGDAGADPVGVAVAVGAEVSAARICGTPNASVPAPPASAISASASSHPVPDRRLARRRSCDGVREVEEARIAGQPAT
jgi:hypothetical protein